MEDLLLGVDLEMTGTKADLYTASGTALGEAVVKTPYDSWLDIYNEIIVTETTGNTTEDWRAAPALVAGGQIDMSALISARYSLAERAAVFAAAQSGQTLKIILEPT